MNRTFRAPPQKLSTPNDDGDGDGNGDGDSDGDGDGDGNIDDYCHDTPDLYMLGWKMGGSKEHLDGVAG